MYERFFSGEDARFSFFLIENPLFICIFAH